MVADGAGVTVNLNGSQLMHRSPVMYPAEALAKGVEGTVVVLRLDANGEVIDDAVLSGPDELRKGVQQSVLSWHFDKSAGSATRVVNIDFVEPAAPAAGVTPLVAPAIRAQIAGVAPVPGGRGGGTASGVPPVVSMQQLAGQQAVVAQANSLANSQRFQGQPDLGGTIERIDVDGLSDSAKAQLLAQLPVHAGDPHSQENMMQLRTVARQFDEHLSVSTTTNNGSGGWVVRISTPGAPSFGTGMNVSSTPPVGAITVAGNAQAMNIVSQTRPVYPPLAKMARQQGTVKFEATIGADGKMQDLKLISGPPLLVPSAMDAVKTWVYNPTLVNGAPVPVVTTIDVSFTLQ
jgi:TonB family protein